MDYKKRLIKILHDENITYNQLGQLLNVSRQRAWGIVNNNNNNNMDLIIDIYNILGYDIVAINKKTKKQYIINKL